MTHSSRRRHSEKSVGGCIAHGQTCRPARVPASSVLRCWFDPDRGGAPLCVGSNAPVTDNALMQWRRETLNRWFVAVMAASCFITAAIIARTHPDEMFWWGGFLRAGVVLVVLWFCLPTQGRKAAWSGMRPGPTFFVLGALFLVVLRPKVGLPILIVVLATTWISNRLRAFLRPSPRRPRGTGPERKPSNAGNQRNPH